MIPTYIATAWARAEKTVRRGFDRLAQGVAEGLTHALSPTEMAATSIAIYDGTAGRATVFDWELEWWARSLPPAPATVLVTGAGAGIEAAALIEMGYIVHAAEPAPTLFEKLKALPVRSARLTDHLGALTDRYDAVIFGWGSFTCVLDPLEHRACLEAAAGATMGPILLSCWMHATAGSRPTHRWARAGRRLGQQIGRLRGVDASPGVRFQHWCGFGYVFEDAELVALARLLGRSMTCTMTPYPHITLTATA